MRTYTITIGGVTRELPIREVAPGVWVALFNPLGDWELNEAVGKELAKRVPKDAEILIMPDGKAQALLHVIGRETKLPTIVARKEFKMYMAQPVVSAVLRSTKTTQNHVRRLYLGADDMASLEGRKVVFVDDVFSTGSSFDAIKVFLDNARAKIVGIVVALTEGEIRPSVISLGHLPLF